MGRVLKSAILTMDEMRAITMLLAWISMALESVWGWY
jgi:hypothetical protein